jgi:hypothetical protein
VTRGPKNPRVVCAGLYHHRGYELRKVGKAWEVRKYKPSLSHFRAPVVTSTRTLRAAVGFVEKEAGL